MERAPAPEIGWTFIQTDLPSLVPGGPWFEWHFDRFELPAGVPALATTPLANQAFTIGRSLGLQFHPEVTAEMIADWCGQVENCGDVREMGSLIDPAAHAARLVEAWDPFFDRWCTEVRSRKLVNI